MSESSSLPHERLFPNIRRVSRIFHVSDVHARNLKRHEEYSRVFRRLYEEIEKRKLPDVSLCVLVGDVVHSKTEMSPELFQIVSRFLKSMADRVPTLVVPGNHDEMANNPDRLDALTPIIASIRHENLEYVRESGLYVVGNTAFSHMYFGDPKDAYVRAWEIPDIYDEKVALYHDVVDKSETDHGHVLESDKVKASFFTGFDKVLLGDIHKRQAVSKHRTDQISVPDEDVPEYEKHGWRRV